MKKNITVFCGSGIGASPAYEAAARELGAAIGREGRGLIFGGCAMGLMRAVSRAAAENGARVLSLRITGMDDPFDADIIAEDRHYKNVQERKLALISESDACIALPGGMGTLDEMTDLYSMTQLCETKTPLGLLNVNGYFDPLLKFFDHMRKEGFLSERYDSMFIVRDTVPELLKALDETGN